MSEEILEAMRAAGPVWYDEHGNPTGHALGSYVARQVLRAALEAATGEDVDPNGLNGVKASDAWYRLCHAANLSEGEGDATDG